VRLLAEHPTTLIDFTENQITKRDDDRVVLPAYAAMVTAVDHKHTDSGR
jgi:hypothetical protein